MQIFVDINYLYFRSLQDNTELRITGHYYGEGMRVRTAYKNNLQNKVKEEKLTLLR